LLFSLSRVLLSTKAPTPIPSNVQGLSNVLVGCAGVGFTGSYIFSQTLFSLRMGVSRPFMGTVIAFAELVVFALPINVLAYVPKFYFGALVIWIGYDITKDWLFIAAKKVSPIEFVLLIFTFVAVTAFGLEVGIAAGIVGAALHFAYEYAQVSVKAFTVVPSRSNAVRTFQQRLVLEAFGGRIAAVALSGMIFFGSATKCVDQILSVASTLLEPQPHVDNVGGNLNDFRLARDSNLGEEANGGEEALTSTLPRPALRTVPSERTLSATYDRLDALKCGSRKGFAGVASALQASPLILLLDLSRVHGIDATAARNFLTLNSRLAVRRGVRLIITGLRPNDTGRRIRKLLGGQGLTMVHPSPEATTSPTFSYDPSSCLCFSSMDEGLRWCEDHFLKIAESYGVCEPQPEFVDLAFVLRNNLQPPPLTTQGNADHTDYAEAAAILGKVSELRKMEPGSVVFTRGKPSDEVLVVRKGAIVCQVDFTRTTVHSRAVAAAVPKGLAVDAVSRTLSYGAGGIVGDTDFMLQRPRSFDARACPQRGAECWVFNYRSFQRLSADSPHTLVLLQTVILRINCLSASHAFELLERTNI
jgi:SulP family sulfate permease